MATIRQRTRQDGSSTYHVQVRLKGHPTQTATFKRKTDAKRWAQQTEAAIKEGRYFQTAEAQKHTVADLVDRYIAESTAEKKDGKNQERQLNWWKERIGDYLLADVRPALIVEWREKMARETTARGTVRAPATVNRKLAALSVAFTAAEKEWQWVESNPVGKVKKKKEPPGRTRFLSEDELPRLLEACKNSKCELLYPAVVFAVSTGMRKGKILNLTWGDIDWGRNVAVFYDTKNAETYSVPLTGHLLDELKKLNKVRRIDTKLVFPGQGGKVPIDLRNHWDAARAEAGIVDFRFHDLKHTAASYLTMQGVSLGELAEILGQKTLQMVKRYSHLAVDHKKKVLGELDKQFFGKH